MKRKTRQLWLGIHRWLGLTVGLVFVLIGLTGSALVFDHAIDEWLNPDLLLTQNEGTPASLQTIIASAESTFSGQALSVSKPRVPQGVYEVWFRVGEEQDPKFCQVLVDPYTAEVKGQRVWGEYLMTWIYRLHFRLMAGEIGAILVGAIGVLILLSLASGIYLWWPLWKHSFRAAFSVRSGKRVYDVHKTTGIVSCLLLGMLAFTGTYMEFPNAFQKLLKPISAVSEHPEGLRSTGGEFQQPLTPDQAVAAAKKHFPEAKFDHLHPPEGKDGVYEVAFRQPGEVQLSFGRSQVFLDQYSGEALVIRSPAGFTAADAFIAWQFPLHNGEAFGLFGRWLVFVSGTLPAILFVSGLLVYRRRSGKRKALSSTANAAS